MGSAVEVLQVEASGARRSGHGEWRLGCQCEYHSPHHSPHPFVSQPGKGGMSIRQPGVTIAHFKLAPRAPSVRERRQYDTHHTYATMRLLAGMNPAFIANPLGHGVEMLLSTYAEWISSSSDWKELEKLPARL